MLQETGEHDFGQHFAFHREKGDATTVATSCSVTLLSVYKNNGGIFSLLWETLGGPSVKHKVVQPPMQSTSTILNDHGRGSQWMLTLCGGSPTDTVDSQYFRTFSTHQIAFLWRSGRCWQCYSDFLPQCAGDIEADHTDRTNCPDIPTTLTVWDLWTDPVGVAALLDVWGKKLGGPRAGV